VRAAILAALQADTALMALLTGGLHTATEISRQMTPTAFDAATQELRPCGLIRMRATAAPGIPTAARAARITAEIYLYERQGYAAIDPAAARCRTLLHKTTLRPATGGAWELTWSNDVPDGRDPALESSLWISRYSATITYL
jgi:hypothetical protein